MNPSLHVITHPDCTAYSTPGHPERPQRISESCRHLKSQTDLPLHWCEPGPVNETQLTRAHAPFHLARIEEGFDFDLETPSYHDIDRHAHRSVGAALTALDIVLDPMGSQIAFSLMRPPGHHATRDRAMGFCYLNQAAIAALEAQSRGLKRIAVFDFDVHHGNGTESILNGRPGFLFHSVHQHPCYPGTGSESTQNCHNHPVLPLTPRQEYREVLQHSLDHIAAWQPDLLIVSAGFDAYKNDPISDELLEAEDFQWIGSAVAKLGCPHLHVLEGGYSDDLPNLIFSYLKGLVI